MFIPGTNRSAILSKTKDDETTMEVHSIQDVMIISEDDEYICTPEHVINVGFPSTTIFHGSQTRDTPSSWQETIVYILNNWIQCENLVIRSGDPKALNTAMTEEFIHSIRYESGFDVNCDEDIEFIAMYVCVTYSC